ncbi:hypothetical protein DV515_00009715 [Chloebia gouldiae]|uniref:Uncharacterized protein n=1 Tax=Chloebia gouldiae TaxID=44316 RepID=A0A3L8SCD8_CHLGU|nr:hypothetical protein DV515_00009715 [Chloebia gouldiae]
MEHSDEATSSKRTLRTLFRPAALPPPVISETSPSQKKLLAYHKGKEQQKMINQLLIDRALEVYYTYMDETDERDAAPPITELPSTVSKYLLHFLFSSLLL